MDILVRSRRVSFFLVLFAAGVTSALQGKESTPSLYERVAARLAERADLSDLDQPPIQLREVEWMLGNWTIEVRVMATSSTPERVEHGESRVIRAMEGHWLQMTDTYPSGTEDISFLTFNRVARLWVNLSLDRHGNAVIARTAGWQDGRLTFVVPEQEILGEKITLRQTIHRTSPDEYVVLNEERLPEGTWRAVDEYRYRRQPAALKTSP